MGRPRLRKLQKEAKARALEEQKKKQQEQLQLQQQQQENKRPKLEDEKAETEKADAQKLQSETSSKRGPPEKAADDDDMLEVEANAKEAELEEGLEARLAEEEAKQAEAAPKLLEDGTGFVAPGDKWKKRNCIAYCVISFYINLLVSKHDVEAPSFEDPSIRKRLNENAFKACVAAGFHDPDSMGKSLKDCMMALQTWLRPKDIDSFAQIMASLYEIHAGCDLAGDTTNDEEEVKLAIENTLGSFKDEDKELLSGITGKIPELKLLDLQMDPDADWEMLVDSDAGGSGGEKENKDISKAAQLLNKVTEELSIATQSLNKVTKDVGMASQILTNVSQQK